MIIYRIIEPVDYHIMLLIMLKSLRKRIKNIVNDHIYILEHNPVITLGVNGKIWNINLSTFNPDIPIHLVNRGGDATLHSPGQMVIYPIIKLDKRGISIKDHITMLENSVIMTLKYYHLKGYWKKGTAGVWVNNRKIASIGIGIKRWTTYHGMAFNVKNDLSLFNIINPCGKSPDIMTSLKKELNRDISLEEVERLYIKTLERLLGEEISVIAIKNPHTLL